MNRSNVGNIATNAVQTLSVSAFTAAGAKRAKDRADLALNAQQERSALNNAKKAEIESRTAKNQANTNLAEEKAEQARLKTEGMKLKNDATAARTERTKQLIEKDKKLSIDDLMQDNSEQVPHIKQKINNDMFYAEQRNAMKEFYNSSNPEGELKELIKSLRR